MTIHPLPPQDAAQSAAQNAAPYDSVWAGAEVPAHPGSPLEQVMLREDKLYVVLAIVLIIWFGVLFFLFRTDRKLSRLERSVETRIPEEREL